jgi:hypothetical protein
MTSGTSPLAHLRSFARGPGGLALSLPITMFVAAGAGMTVTA